MSEAPNSTVNLLPRKPNNPDEVDWEAVIVGVINKGGELIDWGNQNLKKATKESKSKYYEVARKYISEPKLKDDQGNAIFEYQDGTPVLKIGDGNQTWQFWEGIENGYQALLEPVESKIILLENQITKKNEKIEELKTKRKKQIIDRVKNNKRILELQEENESLNEGGEVLDTEGNTKFREVTIEGIPYKIPEDREIEYQINLIEIEELEKGPIDPVARKQILEVGIEKRDLKSQLKIESDKAKGYEDNKKRAGFWRDYMKFLYINATN